MTETLATTILVGAWLVGVCKLPAAREAQDDGGVPHTRKAVLDIVRYNLTFTNLGITCEM